MNYLTENQTLCLAILIGSIFDKNYLFNLFISKNEHYICRIFNNCYFINNINRKKY